jgi:hypothetical protein
MALQIVKGGIVNSKYKPGSLDIVVVSKNQVQMFVLNLTLLSCFLIRNNLNSKKNK